MTLIFGLQPGLRQSVVNLLSEELPLELPKDFSPKQVVADVQSVSVQLVTPELSLIGAINAVDPAANKRLTHVVQQYRLHFFPNANIDQVEQTVTFCRLDRRTVEAANDLASQFASERPINLRIEQSETSHAGHVELLLGVSSTSAAGYWLPKTELRC